MNWVDKDKEERNSWGRASCKRKHYNTHTEAEHALCTRRDERRRTSTQTDNDTNRKMQTSCQRSRQRSKSSQRRSKMLATCRYKVTTRALKRQGRNINNHDQSQHRIQFEICTRGHHLTTKRFRVYMVRQVFPERAFYQESQLAISVRDKCPSRRPMRLGARHRRLV